MPDFPLFLLAVTLSECHIAIGSLSGPGHLIRTTVLYRPLSPVQSVPCNRNLQIAMSEQPYTVKKAHKNFAYLEIYITLLLVVIRP